MSTDKNFSTADNNDPRPLTEESGISGNNTENARQEPKYTQLYGLEGADGKMSLDPQASPEFQGAKGKEEPHKRISKQFDIDPKTHKSLLIAQAIKNILSMGIRMLWWKRAYKSPFSKFLISVEKSTPKLSVMS